MEITYRHTQAMSHVNVDNCGLNDRWIGGGANVDTEIGEVDIAT